MHILFIFVDGVGLGDDDPQTNPFALADTPTLIQLSNNKRWLAGIGIQQATRSTFIPTNPRMGVEGRPQSGTGHATIVTGKNIPSIIGRHYGPKPDAQTRQLIEQDNIFKRINSNGGKAVLINGYPPNLLDSIAEGKTLRSGMQHAAYTGGQELFTVEDVLAGKALTPEWTGDAWTKHLGIETPHYTPYEAGVKLVELSRSYDFMMHSYWISDYVGHRGTMDEAIKVLQDLDGVMSGILDTWDDTEGLVILTSDHGNMERIGDRKHTENDVPTLIIGQQHEDFAQNLETLADLTPRITHFLSD